MAALDFWYEFASTYSYLSAVRISEAAKEAEVEIRWRPFILGPIFHAHGWESSPFNLYPAKGRYMRRELERTAAKRGVTFSMPRPFPQNSLFAARVAVIAQAEGWVEEFSLEVFRAQFAEGEQIDDPQVLARCLMAVGKDPRALLVRVKEEGIKNLLKAHTAQAQALGIFGAPSFVAEDGELFWGDDRLEEALAWAKQLETDAKQGDDEAPKEGEDEGPEEQRPEAQQEEAPEDRTKASVDDPGEPPAEAQRTEPKMSELQEAELQEGGPQKAEPQKAET